MGESDAVCPENKLLRLECDYEEAERFARVLLFSESTAVPAYLFGLRSR